MSRFELQACGRVVELSFGDAERESAPAVPLDPAAARTVEEGGSVARGDELNGAVGVNDRDGHRDEPSTADVLHDEVVHALEELGGAEGVRGRGAGVRPADRHDQRGADAVARDIGDRDDQRAVRHRLPVVVVARLGAGRDIPAMSKPCITAHRPGVAPAGYRGQCQLSSMAASCRSPVRRFRSPDGLVDVALTMTVSKEADTPVSERTEYE